MSETHSPESHLLDPDDANTCHILGQSCKVDDEADVVLVFPLKCEDNSKNVVKWNSNVHNANSLAKRIFVRREGCVDDLELDRVFPKGPMPNLKFHKLCREKFIELLTGELFGMDAETSISIDQDEVFLKIKISVESVKHFAASEGYSIPLKESAEYIPPKNDEGVKICGMHPYLKGKSEYFQKLRHADCLRLFYRRLNDFINLPEMKRRKLLLHDFCVHKWADVSTLRDDWANIKKSYKLPSHSMDDTVRNYFGEEVGFLFHWFTFYTRSLVGPALIGSILYFRKFFLELELQREMGIVFAVFMAFWAAFFNEFYNRKVARQVQKWGMKNYESKASVLASYNENISEEETTKWKVIGYLTAAIFVGLIVGGIMIIQFWRYNMHSDPNHYFLTRTYGVDVAAKVSALAITVQIKSIDFIWGKLAKFLTNRENHKTQQGWNASLTTKAFVVKFLNAFYPFCYVAFAKKYIEGCPHTATGCVPELQKNLEVFFVVHTIAVICKLLYFQFVVKREVQKEVDEVREAGKESDYTYLQLQAKTKDQESILDDYMELSLQYGFVTCFSVVLPIIVLLALASNMLEIRLLAYRNACVLRRPRPRGAEGIGVWADIFNSISVFAVIINCGLAVFAMHPIKDYSMITQLLIFLACEHFLMGLKLGVEAAIPDVPKSVSVVDEKNEEYILSLIGRTEVEPVKIPSGMLTKRKIIIDPEKSMYEYSA